MGVAGAVVAGDGWVTKKVGTMSGAGVGSFEQAARLRLNAVNHATKCMASRVGFALFACIFACVKAAFKAVFDNVVFQFNSIQPLAFILGSVGSREIIAMAASKTENRCHAIYAIHKVIHRPVLENRQNFWEKHALNLKKGYF